MEKTLREEGMGEQLLLNKPMVKCSLYFVTSSSVSGAIDDPEARVSTNGPRTV